jgi:hypothetical protein
MKKLNCAIFRHGIYKKSGKQINPRMKIEECEKLIINDEIYGRGLQFKVIKSTLDDKCLYKTIIYSEF